MAALAQAPDREFDFEKDSFAFANELVWRYEFDSASGAMRVSRSDPPPVYWHRCFVMVRAARQFFYHARFDPPAGRQSPDEYRALIRQVIARTPRQRSTEAQQVVFRGYASLREFSRSNEQLLKEECGAAWESY